MGANLVQRLVVYARSEHRHVHGWRHRPTLFNQLPLPPLEHRVPTHADEVHLMHKQENARFGAEPAQRV